ncbi:MAG TPA: hypothetical protein VN520_25580 [Streptomyces sp.]|uniref:hypothetical protein n=1 Tax=Streptomyces sp. TaxID=1931 RepID=UPI002CD809D1|nr:hypothetical protein [Streptomyces sp.]HWU09708.1 hypothetical protein [Streptomyces sp.]
MSSAPQMQTQEISDADLDNVSGGVVAGLAGEVSLDTPLSSLSVGISGAAGVDVLGVAGLGTATTLSA